jgi:hypothetical protein
MDAADATSGRDQFPGDNFFHSGTRWPVLRAMARRERTKVRDLWHLSL